MRDRAPKWHKPRTALAVSLGFGAFVATGALLFREPGMLAFAGVASSFGLGVFAIDCALHRWMHGAIRPPEVLRADLIWTGATTSIGILAGLASPLYVG